MTYSETFSIALRASDTGLTLKAALVGTDGTIDATLRDIATGFTEHGAGAYQWRYASFADGFNGSVVFYTGTLGAASDFSGVTVKASGVAGLAELVANAVDALRSGAGANAVTVTVSDSSGVIQGARVSIVGTTLKLTTGSAGTAVFNLDAGSYSVRVSAPSGYTDPADTAVTVDGTEAVAITITATGSVAPPDGPLLSTLSVLCVDETGAAEADVTIEARLVEIPTSGTGLAYTGVKQTDTSGVDGVATLTLVRLAKYQVRRGASDWSETVTIPDAGTSTITSFIGAP